MDQIFKLTIPTPFAVGDVHIYLLKGEALTLIDAGVKTDEAWDALKTELKKIGYTPNDIDQIILTHHHPDHIGLIERFDRLEGVYGHKNVHYWLSRDQEYFAHYLKFFEGLYKKTGVEDKYFPFLKKSLDYNLSFASKGELTGTLQEGDWLPGHRDWYVIETPGHAQSHLSFFREKDGAILAGDHLLYHISPNPLLEPPAHDGDLRPTPLLQYRQSMEKCLTYPIKDVYPGHGPNFSNVQPLIEERFVKQENRSSKVLEIIGDRQMTAFQVCQKLFPKHIDKEFGLTMSETIGQLDYLESIEKVVKNIKNGIETYRFVG